MVNAALQPIQSQVLQTLQTLGDRHATYTARYISTWCLANKWQVAAALKLLMDKGLVERADVGRYRLTAAGRAAEVK